MKRILCGVVASVTGFAVVGCGGATSSPPTATPTPSPIAAPTATQQMPATSTPATVTPSPAVTVSATAGNTPTSPSTPPAGGPGTPTPIVVTVAPTPAPGTTVVAGTIDDSISGFSLALIRGDPGAAAGYLTPALRASAGTSLLSTLGLQTPPRRYTYILTGTTPASTTARVTYHTAAGSVVDDLALVGTPSGWLIASITRLGG